jgi:RNA polymerase sigma factor (sigma-70 family)
MRDKTTIAKFEPWPEMEKEWPAKTDAGWPAFRERVANQFYRLLWHEGGRWYFHNAGSKLGSLEDCVQVASVTLLRAIDGFDPSKGIKFITYAVKSIRSDLSRASDNSSGVVHIPPAVVADMRNGRNPGNCRYEYAERAASILPLEDWARTTIPERDHIVFQREEWELTKKALAYLDPRAKEVITRRYLQGEMLHEVGSHLGISKERVRQIEKKALFKLRRLLSNCFESSET